MFKGFQRKIGAQPGNQNARKHGFYSKVLTQSEKHALKTAEDLDGLDQEIAILRLKLRSLLANDGQNIRLITQTVETLGKLYHIKSTSGSSDSSKLKEALEAVMDEFVIPEPPNPNDTP